MAPNDRGGSEGFDKLILGSKVNQITIMNKIKFVIGNRTLEGTIIPSSIIDAANKRIQKKVDPILKQVKRTRAKATVRARTIFVY